MNKKIMVFALIAAMLLSTLTAFGVGSGPNYNGNERIKDSRVTSHEDMATQLERYARQSDLIELEVIGQSVKGRDLFLVKFGEYDESKPTVLYLTQQHGNEVMATEGALNVIRNLSANSRKNRELAENINILFVPRINPDGGAGDVNFDISNHLGGGLATRTNANGIDLNRDHEPHLRTQPETQALHEKVLQQYAIDYAVDFHHQGARAGDPETGQLVSGSMLYPTNPNVDAEIVEATRRFGAIAYNSIEEKGWGYVLKYNGGPGANIARNGFALEYGIANLLFEMRGMIDHTNANTVLGQKSNGYLIQQAVVIMESQIEAIADGSIHDVDTKFWDDLPIQRNVPREEGEVVDGIE